jgi:uncharacterized repeat protein (TIGR03803 family)
MNATSLRSFKKTSTHFARTGAAALALAIVFALALIATPAQAQTYTVIHSFTGGADGSSPQAGLTIDAAGNLYGTTSGGGMVGGNCGNGNSTCGVVFKLKRSDSGWVISPLYSFTGGDDGANPSGRVAVARDGTLYGTTGAGGGTGCIASLGCGTVFHLAPSPTAPKSALAPWNESVIYRFNGADGDIPQGDLTLDQAGNIYGTTFVGGRGACLDGCGLVYELTPSGSAWTETVLYGAQGIGDGAEPVDGVIFGKSGNLYGAFESNGPFNWGAIYQLSPSGSGWTEQTAYGFSGGNRVPQAGLISDASGNLYGTTKYGGSPCGTIFELTPSNGGWTLNTLYDFLGAPDGCDPQAKLIMDAAGNLYGTTPYGGPYGGSGYGVVFKLTPSNGGWTYTLLHGFNYSDGAYPVCSLVFDPNGNLYGTTTHGGISDSGVVFEITP